MTELSALLPAAADYCCPQACRIGCLQVAAYFISDAVDSLDLSAFPRRYAGGGPRNQPFIPPMVKVLLYGVRHGRVQFAQDRAQNCTRMGVPGPGGKQLPGHRTLSDFRAVHLEEF